MQYVICNGNDYLKQTKEGYFIVGNVQIFEKRGFTNE